MRLQDLIIGKVKLLCITKFSVKSSFYIFFLKKTKLFIT